MLKHVLCGAVWEVRHGSMMALREILSAQAASAAVVAPTPESKLPEPITDSSAKNSLPSSPRKECIIDLNLDLQSEEDNGDIKKPKEDMAPMLDNHTWTGLSKVVDPKPGWITAGLASVKTELSLGSVKPELNLSSVKPELSLGSVQSELDLSVVKPEMNVGEVKPDLELDLNMEVIEESLPVKEESSFQVKEETKSNSKFLGNELWIHPGANTQQASNNSKVVTAAKRAWAANVEFLQDCTIRFLCVFALDR